MAVCQCGLNNSQGNRTQLYTRQLNKTTQEIKNLLYESYMQKPFSHAPTAIRMMQNVILQYMVNGTFYRRLIKQFQSFVKM